MMFSLTWLRNHCKFDLVLTGNSLLDKQAKDSPLSVKALKRTLAKPHWAFSGNAADGMKSSA